MSTGRFLGGMLIGGALGVLIGMLIAPRSGEETREIIRDELGDRLNRSVDTVKSRTADVKSLALDKADELRGKSQQIAHDIEETGREVWNRVKTGVATLTPKSPDENPN